MTRLSPAWPPSAPSPPPAASPSTSSPPPITPRSSAASASPPKAAGPSSSSPTSPSPPPAISPPASVRPPAATPRRPRGWQPSSPAATRPAPQEPIVPLRDGRYVVPVKAEMRSQLPGIVHDVSSSGATVFLEPLEAVEMGNAWRELQAEEEREVRRILRALSEQVGGRAVEIAAAVDALAALDLALAKARLGE